MKMVQFILQNDSKYIMSVGKKVEDTKKSDVITVKPVTKNSKKVQEDVKLNNGKRKIRQKANESIYGQSMER